MDFHDAPEDAAFRSEARRWLATFAKPKGDAADVMRVFEERGPEAEAAWVADCRAWQQRKFEAGYAAVTWPPELGGRNGSLLQEIIFREEEDAYDVAVGAFNISLGMIAPTIRRYGSPEQQAHLVEMLSGRELWCQMFSEPEAGSDLAGVRLRAVREGDGWILNGQKVWTSGAHYADWGYLLARSDPAAPRHGGITAFVLPMDTPGVEVRPLRQMTGGADFNEVFFHDVRLSDSARLGPEGAGWKVAVTTLMNERVSAASRGGGEATFRSLCRHAAQHRRADDPLIRARLAEIYSWLRIQEFNRQRILTALARGEEPGPEGSIGKLSRTKLTRAMAEIAAQIGGAGSTVVDEWTPLLLGFPGLRLAGGTDEIMRNIIGERVLGLPREPSEGN